MVQKSIPNETAIIEDILRRKANGRGGKRIPSAKMKIFKAKLGEEIKRSGELRPEFVTTLLQQLQGGEF